MTNPCDLSMTEARRLIMDESLSAVELMESVLDRMPAPGVTPRFELEVRLDDGSTIHAIR